VKRLTGREIETVASCRLKMPENMEGWENGTKGSLAAMGFPG
jgi:hypothetical protein